MTSTDTEQLPSINSQRQFWNQHWRQWQERNVLNDWTELSRLKLCRNCRVATYPIEPFGRIAKPDSLIAPFPTGRMPARVTVLTGLASPSRCLCSK